MNRSCIDAVPRHLHHDLRHELRAVVSCINSMLQVMFGEMGSTIGSFSLAGTGYNPACSWRPVHLTYPY